MTSGREVRAIKDRLIKACPCRKYVTFGRVRVLNPRIKEWKIYEFCGLSFYRTEGSKRKYCSRETCTEALLCVRLSGPSQCRRG
jgi:hypothetical protein